MPVPETPAGRVAPEREATALRGYRVEAIMLLADEEARRAHRPCMTSRERKNARRRRDGWAESIVGTPEGRELLRHEAEIIAGARPAARAMAKAVPEYREVLGAALDAYVSSVVEYGLESTTARSFALQGAILSTASTALLGEAFEGGTRTMSGTRSAKDDKGVTGSIQVAGFRDLAQLAAAFVTKSQIAIETAWRCEDRARLEAKERARQETHRAAVARVAAERMAREDEEPELAELDADHDVDTDCLLPVGVTEEHGARGEEDSLSPSSPRADDLDLEHDQELRELVPPPLEQGAFCKLRGKIVPASLAGKPTPGAASGPDWPQRLAAENAQIAAWEKANELTLRRAIDERSRKQR